MDTSNHYTMVTLFEQLGLPSEQAQIDVFIQTHPLPDGMRIENAPFWTPAQKAFLAESITEDSDWVELIDHLDALLRN